MSLYEKINVLVPNPKYDCNTPKPHPEYSDIVWRDARPMPTEAEVNAVTDAQIADAQKDLRALELQQAKDAFSACLEEVFAFVKNPTLHNTANSLKQAVLQRYKDKL